MNKLEDHKSLQKEFGTRVRLLRKSRKMTQVQLAEKAGIHSSFLSSIERGVTSVSLESIYSIAQALKVHPGRLFPEDEIDEKAERLITWFTNNRRVNLEKIIDKLVE